MKETIRDAMLSMAMIGMLCIGAAAQNTDQSTNSSATTKHHVNANTDTTGSKLDAVDRHFIRKAGQGGLAEVELGKLAAEKGQSDEVKKFGQRMVDDHSKANDQLKQLAESKGIMLPTDLDAKDKATKAKLEKLNGAEFDRAYMKDMVVDHTKDVSEFKKASITAKDPDVKSFASQTLPTLEDHLKQAQGIAPKKTKAGTAGGR